jgi:hypothetical protein
MEKKDLLHVVLAIDSDPITEDNLEEARQIIEAGWEIREILHVLYCYGLVKDTIQWCWTEKGKELKKNLAKLAAAQKEPPDGSPQGGNQQG